MYMPDQRSQGRVLCADIVEAEWAGGRRTALLEDISPAGACLQLEEPVALGTHMRIGHRHGTLESVVRYCVYREIGYFVGVEFIPGTTWSAAVFRPRHLLDLKQLVQESARRAMRRVNACQ